MKIIINDGMVTVFEEGRKIISDNLSDVGEEIIDKEKFNRLIDEMERNFGTGYKNESR